MPCQFRQTKPTGVRASVVERRAISAALVLVELLPILSIACLTRTSAIARPTEEDHKNTGLEYKKLAASRLVLGLLFAHPSSCSSTVLSQGTFAPYLGGQETVIGGQWRQPQENLVYNSFRRPNPKPLIGVDGFLYPSIEMRRHF